MHNALIFAAIVGGVSASVSVSASAQRTWPVPGNARFISFEVGKGVFREFPVPDGTGSVNAASYTVTASGRLPLSHTIAFTWEIPFSRVSATMSYNGATASLETGYRFGSPWLGIERMSERGLSFEAGIRPGLVKPAYDAIGTAVLNNGIAADYDHYEAWLPGYSVARVMLRYDRQVRGAFFVTGIAGGSISVTTGEEGLEDGVEEEEDHEEEEEGPDYYAIYGLRAGLRVSAITADAALLGRYYPTATGPNSEPFVNQLAFELSANRGSIQPAASARFYFDRLLRPRTKATFSAGVTIFY